MMDVVFIKKPECWYEHQENISILLLVINPASQSKPLMSNINSPVWFITGANHGLGLEITKAGLAFGYRIVATARNAQSINQEFSPDGDHLLSLPIDVTNASSIKTTVNHTKETFLRIDVLVNNAGYGQMGAFEAVTPEAVLNESYSYCLGLFRSLI
jgi:NADP-dependent 3-hydroxy acid dehydrogenase YdfG